MSFALYAGGALAFSAAAVLALAAALELERRWRRRMVPALYLLLLLYGCIAPFLWARDPLSPVELADPGGAGKWLMRLFIAAALAICAARMAGAAFSRENRGAGGGVLLAALGIYFLTSVVLSSAWGAHPRFMHEHYYVPFLFAAVHASRTHDPEIAVRFAKAGFLLFVAASWAAVLLVPDLAMERNHESWIPGIEARFRGLANHANSMGPAALVFLLLALHQPFERRWVQRLGLVLGFAALLAAQSRTAWSAAALSIPLLLILRSAAWGAAAFSLVGLGAAVAGALLVLPFLGVSLEGLASDGYEALSLSGRDDIWALAVQEWVRHPLFGYGPTMWDRDYRLQVGLAHAESAHNQFLQTLSVAGAMGLIGLMVYLAALSLYAIRAWRASRGLSVALLTLLLLRCVTETPLTIGGFLTGGFAAQLLLFQLALAYGSRTRSAA